MSYDRIIRWSYDAPKPPPTLEELTNALKEYIHESGTVEVKDSNWIVVYLIGRAHDPFLPKELYEGPRAVRAFEVFYQPTGVRWINVITRQADRFTLAVAEGAAQLVAQVWRGKREE
jgi:hypothetical protein